jgi:hypothetical protein
VQVQINNALRLALGVRNIELEELLDRLITNWSSKPLRG